MFTAFTNKFFIQAKTNFKKQTDKPNILHCYKFIRKCFCFNYPVIVL